MLLRTRRTPSGFIDPSLPYPADRPPSGPEWVHEIKHDGCRLMARRDPIGIRLPTRNGHDWASRYPLIVEAVDRLKVRSCLIDGEAVACDGDGLPCFDRLRYRRQDGHVFLYAFDLIELDGDDLRREPIERRKAALAKLLRHTKAGFLLNEHIDEPGDVVFRHACKLGLGIVSKRLGSPYHSGRSRHWVKSKNPQHPAVKREAEEDWGKMTHRKREIIGLRNERDFPHLVELALPPEGFRSVLLEIDAFHRERRIPVRRGRSRREVKQVYIRFCFRETATADAFRKRFGGECFTYTPDNPKPPTSATS